ncbi:MAG: serine hydrolase [Candidatus Aminicenantes bacterium]|nr:serine hydrolase [Candidatus Aminicenantes bacterium]
MKSSTFRSLLTLIVLLIFISSLNCVVQPTFPGKTWKKIDKPEKSGYSAEKLKAVKDFTKSINTAAVVIVVKGVILDEWGDVTKKFQTHSTRKSFLSAVYGNYVKKGIIDLKKTMAELGIDDEPPLSEEEKKATIRDCLEARSGIYHPALYESQSMKALKPERYSQKPGTHWYYNNWDFNVLCTIFEHLTGKKFFDALKTDIADPIGMEDFKVEDGMYFTGKESIHPAYPFRITARDMARFGLLMLRKGKWQDKQVIPEEWVDESTGYYSDAALYSSDGYGYMWWVAKDNNNFPHLPNVKLKEGAYSARGSGGHYLLVIPEYDMVIVHRVNTDVRGNYVTPGNMGRLIKMILDAKIK